VLGKDGQLDYFYGVGIDVTEQKRYREALYRSQQRLGLHFQQSPLGMIEWGLDFRVLDWNPAAERMFGWSREEALGRSGLELMVPEPVQPFVANLWESVLHAKGAVHAENDNLTKDGRTIFCEWTNTALVDEDGDVVGVASLIADVTDQKRAREDLKNRERAQAETIQQLSAPVIDVWEGVLALPVIGTVDDARATRMMESLLSAIVESGARFAILDMTGATEMDGSLATHLGNMVRAAGLLGSECIVSGLGPRMARALVDLDLSISVRTFGTLQAALRYAIRASRPGREGKRVLPGRGFVIFEELPPSVRARVQAGEDRVADASGAVDDIEGRVETVHRLLSSRDFGGIFVGDPPCIHAVQVDAVLHVILRRGAREHVERSLGHIRMRVFVRLEIPIELAFHGRDIHDVFVSRGHPHHQVLELAREDKRGDRIDEVYLDELDRRDLGEPKAPAIFIA